MRTIEFKNKFKPLIRYGRVKPFLNTCPVTGEKEWCNVEVEYKPTDKVLDIVSYRKYIETVTGGGMLIEDIADKIFNEINNLINPSSLMVRVYLEGNPHLSDWSVTIEK